MDAGRFDRMARALVAQTSRRDTLKTLAGGALAGTLGLVAGRGAAAEHDSHDCPYYWYHGHCYKYCKHGWHYCHYHGKLYCCKGHKRRPARKYHDNHSD